MNGNNSFNDIITCRNCGTINMSGTKRCVKCGKRLHASKKGNNSFSNVFSNIGKTSNKSNRKSNSDNSLIAFMASNVPTSSIQQSPFVSINDTPTEVQANDMSDILPMVEVDNNQNIKNIPAEKINYVSYLINVFLKPFDKYKSEENNFNLMNTGILLGIMSVVMAIVGLFVIVMNIIRENSLFSDKVVWKFNRLANINYIKILLVNILMFAGILIGIALVYYFASSIILKKKVNLFRLLGAVVTAFTPLVVAFLVGQLLALISSFFGLAIVSIGGIYSFMILIELINYNIGIDSNDKSTLIYFNSICLSIVILVLGPIFYNTVASFISAGMV